MRSLGNIVCEVSAPAREVFSMFSGYWSSVTFCVTDIFTFTDLFVCCYFALFVSASDEFSYLMWSILDKFSILTDKFINLLSLGFLCPAWTILPYFKLMKTISYISFQKLYYFKNYSLKTHSVLNQIVTFMYSVR